jgi:hypothetical protein
VKGKTETLKAETLKGGLQALSIRQPWAWLILHGGKDIENRTWFTTFTGTVLIHASQTMTRGDYEAAVIFCSGLGFTIKDFPFYNSAALQRGGIVGRMDIMRCAQSHLSPWFTGPYGLVIEDARPLPFQPCRGHLKFFTPNLAPESVSAFQRFSFQHLETGGAA